MTTLSGTASDSPLREYLFGLTLHGIKLGLENIHHLLDAAGNPQLRYPTVHVAGTNGKGSTLAILASILHAAGYRTGRFTSPHLIHVNERFLLNGTPVSDGALDEQIRFFREAAEAMDHSPTFFEMNTAIAFHLFAEAKVDLGLIEVGMGGRFDSTNVLQPEATAITSIGLDHTEFLGDTPEAIAGEKAGIIKPGVPVVLGEIADGPRDVIQDEAERLEAPILVCGRDYSVQLSGDAWQPRLRYASASLTLDDLPFGLTGTHQAANAGVAIMLAEHLRNRFSRIDTTAIAKGLETVRWPCRMEQVLDAPPVFIDSAHNPAGAQTIAAMPRRWTVLLAMSSDKDAAGVISALAPVADSFIFSEYTERRAMPAANLAAAAGNTPHQIIPNLSDALDAGLVQAAPERPLLITGSIYTAGEARQLLTALHGAPGMTF